MGQLDHKTAVITGGGTGIGRTIAKRFHNEGAFVAIAGRRNKKLILEGGIDGEGTFHSIPIKDTSDLAVGLPTVRVIPAQGN